MTDNDIKKALECCLGNTKCNECPIFGTVNCMNKVFGYALDLINRQKAEIERLNKEVDRLSQCVMYHDGQIVDAIKEFAERLTDKADLIKANAFDSRWAIWQDDIDNLVKEMTEVSK